MSISASFPPVQTSETSVPFRNRISTGRWDRIENIVDEVTGPYAFQKDGWKNLESLNKRLVSLREELKKKIEDGREGELDRQDYEDLEIVINKIEQKYMLIQAFHNGI